MILCCGEALIDMVPIEGGFAPLPGGAIFNTAIALGRLEKVPGFFSGLSSDLFGDVLRDSLAASNVDTSLITSADRPTTLAFVKLTDGHASYSFYDENTAGRMLSIADLPALPPVVDTLYFGGISLCAEPAADAYATLAMRESEARVIMLDPNIRPGFITDEARYRKRLSGMIAVSDIVKVSDEDLDWILPGSDDSAHKARSLMADGPAIVIVTLGSKGAVAYFGDGQTVEVSAPKATVVDTVGAGDTFNSGVLAALQDKELLQKRALRSIAPEPLSEALEMGAKVAAVTVSRAGANPPWLHELS